MLAAAVLTLGALEQRGAQARFDTPPVDPLPMDVPRQPVVRPDLDKTPLTYFADYWGQLAERAGPRLTSIGSARTPALVVGPRLVLTTLAPALEALARHRRPDLTVAPDADDGAGGALRSGGESAADDPLPPELDGYWLLGWDEGIGLALFEASGEERTPFTLTDPRAMTSGSYVGAVTLTSDGAPAVVPGYLVTAASRPDEPAGDLVVSMDLSGPLSIAAVVNLDGGLIGVAYAAPAGRRVVSAMTMLELIDTLQAEKVCRSVEVTDLGAGVKEIMVLESGVLIEYVHRAAFVPEPSLLAGDILLEWADTRVDSAAHFAQLYDAQAPGELVRYRVLRNRRRFSGRTVVPGPDCAPVAPPPVSLPTIGMAVQWEPRPGAAASGWRVVAVAPDSPAAEAGIEERDQLLAIDNLRLSDEDDRETITGRVARGERLLLSLRREERMKLLSVAPLTTADPADAAGDPRRSAGR